MTITKNLKSAQKMEDKIKYIEIEILNPHKTAVQRALKTRICRSMDSKYENAPSREIKRWFESRKFNF